MAKGRGKSKAFVKNRSLTMLKKSAEGRALVAVGLAAYAVPFTMGVNRAWRGAVSRWEPNAESYLARPEKRGKEPWVLTGDTLRSMTNNPPSKLGKQRGLKVVMNWRQLVMYARPEVFRAGGAKGRRMTGDGARAAFNSISRGSLRAKLEAHQKKTGVDLVAEGEVGLRRFDKNRKMPARPLLIWTKAWEGEAARMVEKELAKQLGGKVV